MSPSSSVLRLPTELGKINSPADGFVVAHVWSYTAKSESSSACLVMLRYCSYLWLPYRLLRFSKLTLTVVHFTTFLFKARHSNDTKVNDIWIHSLAFWCLCCKCKHRLQLWNSVLRYTKTKKWYREAHIQTHTHHIVSWMWPTWPPSLCPSQGGPLSSLSSSLRITFFPTLLISAHWSLWPTTSWHWHCWCSTIPMTQ